MRARWRGPASLLVLAVLLGASRDRDPRSVEILRRDCRSELGRRDVTLFGNGTVRLRLWNAAGELDMELFELPPGEVEAVVDRLLRADLSQVHLSPAGPDEGWMDACTLTMDLPGAEPVSYRYGQLDALPLALSPLLSILEELTVRAGSNEQGRGLGDGYTPRPGDVLLRRDGRLYEVIGPTSDGQGLELVGVAQPVTIYVVAEAIGEEFVMLVERRGTIRQ